MRTLQRGFAVLRRAGNFRLTVRRSFRASIRAHALGVVMMTTADVLIETLIDWGRGYRLRAAGRWNQRPGGITADRQDQIRFVQVRHEESAAF